MGDRGFTSLGLRDTSVRPQRRFFPSRRLYITVSRSIRLPIIFAAEESLDEWPWMHVARTTRYVSTSQVFHILSFTQCIGLNFTINQAPDSGSRLIEARRCLEQSLFIECRPGHKVSWNGVISSSFLYAPASCHLTITRLLERAAKDVTHGAIDKYDTASMINYRTQCSVSEALVCRPQV